MPKTPCFYQPLHNDYYPASCSEAPLSGADLTISAIINDDEWYIRLFSCTWITLGDAADAGCPTCQIIRQDLCATEEWTDPDKKLNITVRRRKGAVFLNFWPPSPPWSFDFKYRQTSQSSMYLADDIANYILYFIKSCGGGDMFISVPMIPLLMLLACLGCRAFAMGNFKFRAIGNSYLFVECRRWIQDCLESHIEYLVENTLLPHRAIDIEYNEGEACRDCTADIPPAN